MITAWAALESMAARLVCERATDEEISTLRTLFADFEDEGLRSHINEYSAANLRFHRRTIELGRSPLILHMAQNLLVHVRAIRGRTIRRTIGPSARSSITCTSSKRSRPGTPSSPSAWSKTTP